SLPSWLRGFDSRHPLRRRRRPQLLMQATAPRRRLGSEAVARLRRPLTRGSLGPLPARLLPLRRKELRVVVRAEHELAVSDRDVGDGAARELDDDAARLALERAVGARDPADIGDLPPV